MNKKLCIHIGGMKTGTTALQIFCAKNRKALQAKGYCYPGTGTAQWEICSDIRDGHREGVWGRTGSSIGRYLAEFRKSACHTAIMSGECLSFPGGDIRHLRELIPQDIPVTIVYYARRQDFLIESYYNQTVKSRHHHIKNRLDREYLEEIYTKTLCDHPRVVQPWAEAFGKENVVVRCYEKQQMQGDIVTDFASVIGLSVDGTFTAPKGRSNSMMDPPHAEFIRLCNTAFPDAPAISKFLFFNRCHRSRLFENFPKRSLLSPALRIEILNRYEESNRTTAREYLGRADGRLFYDPWPDPDEPWEPYRGLTMDELALITEEMIRNTGQDIAEQEPVSALLRRLNRACGFAAGILPEKIRDELAEKAVRWNRLN